MKCCWTSAVTNDVKREAEPLPREALQQLYKTDCSRLIDGEQIRTLRSLRVVPLETLEVVRLAPLQLPHRMRKHPCIGFKFAPQATTLNPCYCIDPPISMCARRCRVVLEGLGQKANEVGHVVHIARGSFASLLRPYVLTIKFGCICSSSSLTRQSRSPMKGSEGSKHQRPCLPADDVG